MYDMDRIHALLAGSAGASTLQDDELTDVFEDYGPEEQPSAGGLNENRNDGMDSLYRRIMGLQREDYAVPANLLQVEDCAAEIVERAQAIAETEGLGGATPRDFQKLAKDCRYNLRDILTHIETGEMMRSAAVGGGYDMAAIQRLMAQQEEIPCPAN